MSPALNNILIAVISLVYVFAVVGIMDFAVRKGFPQDISRKVVHIAAGSWLIFWMFYDQSHWTKFLNITPALVWSVLLLIKGFTAKPDDEAVKTMTRTGDRKELLKGPFYFTVVMNLMGTLFFFTPLALTSMGILGWGDGLAPVIGKRFGKHKYRIFSDKTIEGSIGFFIFGFFGALLFQLLIMGNFDAFQLLICVFVATIVEALSPADMDNILIPAAVAFLYIFIF